MGMFGGAAGGWMALVGQARQQERQQRFDRQRRLEEARQDAYSVCISTSKQVSARWWRVAAVLRSDGSTAEQWAAAAAEAHAAWAPFSAAVATVTVVGPVAVAGAAEDLRRSMLALDRAAVAWHEAARAAGRGGLPDFDERYMEAVAAKRLPGKLFQQAARSALGTDT
ncbi:hypothetical protein [Kitasatospora cineracea]|uniref:hypothetical protein n=1 Tax=Kitasatospora cineracea TaxID=88074 RepID=UPI000F4F12C4|nr:hypothetical protein [Kitasatospora cineracea]